MGKTGTEKRFPNVGTQEFKILTYMMQIDEETRRPNKMHRFIAEGLFGVADLPKRISVLQKMGFTFEKTRKVSPAGQRYMRYRLVNG